MSQLPDKPSELIRTALDDLVLCEKDDRYVINMHKWHDFRYRCEVCLAGAVIAKELGADPETSYSTFNFREESRKLRALDEFRTGYISVALDVLDIPEYEQKGIPIAWGVCPYSENRDTFFKDMHNMADMLEEHGL